MSALAPMRILVVEDDLLVATQLCDDLTELAQVPVGPFASLDDAILGYDTADAAILDMFLGADRSFGIAAEFRRRGLPFLFYTGYDRDLLPQGLKTAPLFHKPIAAEALLQELRAQRRMTGPGPSALEVLPHLRFEARVLMEDGAAADRLVEAVLQEAVRSSPERDKSQDLGIWLMELLQEEYRRHGRDLFL
jgi:DNA-binding response OmpR family regulator